MKVNMRVKYAIQNSILLVIALVLMFLAFVVSVEYIMLFVTLSFITFGATTINSARYRCKKCGHKLMFRNIKILTVEVRTGTILILDKHCTKCGTEVL